MIFVKNNNLPTIIKNALKLNSYKNLKKINLINYILQHLNKYNSEKDSLDYKI